MTDAAAIKETLSLYKKHGWILRRILITPELQGKLASEHREVFNGVEERLSDINAAWFSRLGGDGRETWELRLLGSTPFALLDVLDQDLDQTEREKALKRIEAKMREFKSRKPTNH
jgi:hypothetical protein